jgi:Protein of unknown function (DUF3313)
MTKVTPEVALTIIALSMTALLGACAQTEQVTSVKPVGGFLPEPSALEPGESGQLALVYLNPDAKWGSYSKMILEPVTIWTGHDSRWDAVPAEQKDALANTLYTHLHDAAAQRCQMVTEPSPGTVRVRVALADAEPSNAALNTISTYVPQAHVLSALTGYAFNDGVGFFAGTATVEGYAADAMTGEILWQGVDKRGGGNAIGTNTLNSWNDVDNAAKAWAEQLTRRLAELGACPA